MSTSQDEFSVRGSFRLVDDLAAEISEELTTEFSNVVVIHPNQPLLQETVSNVINTLSSYYKVSALEIPDGESGKSLSICEQIWQHLEDQQSNRRTLLIGIGGGAVLDVAGFAASTFMRGIAFWSIPTTLLSMVDAGIGGKTAINFSGFKNHVGTFTHPSKIWICPQVLRNLPESEMLNGWAECVKHGLLEGDELWEKCKNQIPPVQPHTLISFWKPFIEQQAMFKAHIVEQDFKENGLRETLNAGHTVAHALESYSAKHRLHIAHGTAVAWGLLIESEAAPWHSTESKSSTESSSVTSENAHSEDWIQTLQYLVTTQYPSLQIAKHHSIESAIEEILEYANSDKKNHNGKIVGSVLESPGNCKIQTPLNKSSLKSLLSKYLQA